MNRSRQDVITEAVKRHMETVGLTQSELGHHLGLSQAAVSQRLAGVRRWSLDDVWTLYEMDVDVPVPFVPVSSGASL